MLWNAVYEFFIKYVFGGVISINGSLVNYNGQFLSYGSGIVYSTSSEAITIFGIPFSFGNYLSLIATIISMVAIVILCCLLIKKIYNICAHVIG